MSLATALLVMLICLLLEAFCAGSEMALVSANRVKLRHLAGRGQRGARLVLGFLDKPELLMGTLIACHNLVFVTNVTIATTLLVGPFGHRWAGTMTLLLMSPLLLTFGEIVPKSIFREKADSIAPRAVFGVWVLSKVLYPLVNLLTRVTSTITKASGKEGSPFVSREELALLVEMAHRGSDVCVEERRMIKRLFGFGDKVAGEVMVPLIDVVAVEDRVTVDEVIAKIEEKGHSRLPVYHGEAPNIIGIVHAMDIFAGDPQAGDELRPFIRPVPYVPEAKRADDLLEELKSTKNPMAIVVDEYGGAVGIVTVEDLLEEIVGEIRDEYDREEPLYRKLPAGGFLVDGRMEIEALVEELGVEIPEGDYETLGGFVITHLERIPKGGETIALKGWTLTVEEATSRSVKRVRLMPRADSAKRN